MLRCIKEACSDEGRCDRPYLTQNSPGIVEHARNYRYLPLVLPLRATHKVPVTVQEDVEDTKI